MNRQDLIDEVTEGILIKRLKQRARDLYNQATQSRDRTEFNVDDEDIISQTKEPPPVPSDSDETPEERQKRKQIEGVFLALSITPGGNAADFRKIVKREVEKVFNKAAVNYAKTQSLRQTFDKVEKAVTANLEKAVTQSFNPGLYRELKEAMVYEITHQIREACGDFSSRKKTTFKENKNNKLKVKING